jgi:CheY-like chemotaxis protein
MTTAYGRQEVMQKAESAGLDGFLIKPVNPSVMLNTILEIFDKEVQTRSRKLAAEAMDMEAMAKITGARILLVEDNEINQQVAREILSGAGFEVVLANNGQEAVDAVQKNPFDAVLMDIQMPVMDGYAASQEIRNLKSEIRNVPVIAMTAHAMAGDRDKSLAAGMNGHVAKPINPQELFATLLKWVKTATPQAETDLPETEDKISTGLENQDSSPKPAPSTAADDLPAFLPGFDLEAGLKRLQGNRGLYRKLLLDFARNYSQASKDIHNALTAGDINQVHSMVHNIKGLAGNLSANRLLEAATEMDSEVKTVLSSEKQVPGQLDSKFAALKTAIEEALTACRALDQSNGESSDRSDNKFVVSLPRELAQRTAAQMHDAADLGDINGLKKIAGELQSISNSYGGISEEILRLAEDFDFDGVHRFADELVTPKESS